MSELTRRTLGLGLAAAGVASLAPTRAAAARPWPYLLGADVTWLTEDETEGATYFEGGRRRDALAILRDAGFNAIKLRLFVDPANGYSKGKPGGPWADIARTVAFGRRIKQAGFHFSLTLHYSDTWADPQHQDKPAAWANLPFARLVDAVHRHTVEALSALKAGGAYPDLVVIGNETTFGMLWPDGRVPLTIPTGNPQTDAVHMDVAGTNTATGGYDRFAALLKAGIAGARETTPDAKVAVHNHLGRHWPIVRYWMDQLLARGVRFDATGFSCYQQAAQGDWQRTFEGFAKAYPDHGFMALEYSSRKRYVNDLVHAQPNGWGSFIWEPIRHQEAIFTRDGVNAGEGTKPDLLSQGINAAEAPGAAPVASTAAAPPNGTTPSRGHGGRYDADPAFLDLYRQMARDYAATPFKPRRH
ncbi:arabinogalactan endo-1,4-beta-galactosidase [Sphingomonas insulae]|uniref:Arabinogalactan endo-beta-1,4-galactanase n=1 Tax=Sphingomonas insulae TaxID=424800 RepID=A0ABN1HNE2_9SPHN|nr:glycosyl hydrolase 53 family protein [Sphingomonas insulae]NIJ30887.1 arabinogalactan endo-1,4-beta-galactosidase [Sphingomonas insulae]